MSGCYARMCAECIEDVESEIRCLKEKVAENAALQARVERLARVAAAAQKVINETGLTVLGPIASELMGLQPGDLAE